MKIIEISEENLDMYTDYFGDDMAENLTRMFYRGIAVVEDDSTYPGAALVFRFVNLEDSAPNEAVIVWMRVEDVDAGAALMEAYKEKIQEKEVVRSTFTIPIAQGKLLKNFLKANGFTVRLYEGDDLISCVEEMTKLPVLDMKIPMEGVYPLSNMLMRDFRKEMTRCVEANRKGTCEDLSYLPMSYFEQNISSYVMKNDEVMGMQLYHKSPSGSLEIKLLIAWTKDFRLVFPQLFKQTLTSAVELYPMDTPVILNRHNEASLLLAEKMFPRGFGRPIYRGERAEE